MVRRFMALGLALICLMKFNVRLVVPGSQRIQFAIALRGPFKTNGRTVQRYDKDLVLSWLLFGYSWLLFGYDCYQLNVSYSRHSGHLTYNQHYIIIINQLLWRITLFFNRQIDKGKSSIKHNFHPFSIDSSITGGQTSEGTIDYSRHFVQ